MAKRGYKLQEFVAHSSNVNCLKIGKKACRLFITGGDDHKIHLWAIGKPTSLMSLYGHTSPVESLAFDSAEVFVAAGASSGMVKLWDLEEAKMVRTLTGHKSNCTAVEFHPFGEFFASGSMDTNLKIWDIRKKGCIHTYKGHTQGISTIKFTPDGRWVVSGGFDNVVKIWDLTAGKLLHEFKFHDGHIRSIDFHPLEFLLATGSADKTVKFWDLETFELIGSSRPEATGVRAIAFHPDGRTLFCGLEDSFKVYSWEPVIRHDAVDMGWSTLGDLCIRDGKLLGCSYHLNSVGVWVSDISLVEPYGNGLPTEHKNRVDQKFSMENLFTQDIASTLRSTSDMHSVSLDDEMKEIKNIYIDSANGKPVVSQQNESASLPRIEVRSDSTEFIDVQAKKQNPSLISTVPAKPGHMRKPSYGRIDSGTNDVKKVLESTRVVVDSRKDCSEDILPDIDTGPTKESSLSRPSGDSSLDCSKEVTSVKLVNGVAVVSGRTRCLVERFERREKFSSQEDSAVSVPDVISEDAPVPPGPHSALSTKENSQGSAVNLPQSQISRIESAQPQLSETVVTESQVSFMEVGETQTEERESLQSQLTGRKPVQPQISEAETVPPQISEKEIRDPQISDREEVVQCQKSNRESFQSQILVKEQVHHQISGAVAPPKLSEKTVRQPQISGREAMQRQKSGRESFQSQFSRRESLQPQISGREVGQPHLSGKDVRRSQISEREVAQRQRSTRDSFPSQINVRESVQRQRSGREVIQSQRSEKDVRQSGRELVQRQKFGRESMQPRISALLFEQPKILGRDFTPLTIRRESVQPQLSGRDLDQVHISEMGFAKSHTDIFESESDFAQPQISDRELAEIQHQVSGTESTSPTDEDTTEILMQTHDVFLSTLKSRLTKLQVVHHFWARNDIKGAIDALRKLPDNSVQADVVSVLTEKLDMLDLDLFSCLLPVLTGLLDSKTERHTQVSLELLLKLVAVFGQVIQSTISARPTVGVDLHAEYRLECCKQCFIQLQKIQKILPLLIRRGGVIARPAQELNLVLEL